MGLLAAMAYHACRIQRAAAVWSCCVPYPDISMWLTRTIASASPAMASCRQQQQQEQQWKLVQGLMTGGLMVVLLTGRLASSCCVLGVAELCLLHCGL
jgi:hypothetical protein